MKENVPGVLLNRTEVFLRKNHTCLSALLLIIIVGISAEAQPVFLKGITATSNHFISSNGNLYYTSADSLFTSDGTPAGTRFVKKTGEPIILVSDITNGSYFYFVTQSGATQSLWKSDGTTANTVKVGSPHNSIVPLIAYHSELYLMIDDGTQGNELWKLTTGDNLTIVKDINPGSASGFIGDLIISNDLLFFLANAGISGTDLWKSNGTATGTTQAVDLLYDNFFGLTDVDGTIFFQRNYNDEVTGEVRVDLWKSQGTQISTALVKAFPPETHYNTLTHFTAMNGKLYFIHHHNIPQDDLMVSDGTEAGTVFIKNVNIDGDITKLIRLNDHLVFYGYSQQFPTPIMKSDGTAAGTQAFHQLNIAHSYQVSDENINLTGAGNLLFFVDHGTDSWQEPAPEDEFQLWQSDLTEENTKQLRTLYDMSFRGSDNIVAAGNNIFFTTQNPGENMKLWFYDPTTPAAMCADAGTILREVWTGVSGSQVSQIPTHLAPTDTEDLTIFEGPTNAGDHYGARIRGYLCVQETGNYRFWISSNDHSELWLSTDDDPANKTRIAYVTGYTNVRQWNKYATQQSALIELQAGRRYYIEALHKEGVGSDHVAVGMQLPDGTLERPIPGNRLMPFGGTNSPPRVEVRTDLSSYVAPATIEIAASASDSDGEIVNVEFFEVSGEEIKLGEDATSPYVYTWRDVPPGEYTLIAKATDDRGAVTTSNEWRVQVQGECMASGTILREVWTGVPGSSVSDIPTGSPPTSTNELTIFEGPSNIGTHYGTRISGYICPPVTGHYVFYIASNDDSELWISTDDDPANKVLIAYVDGATGIRQWDKYPSQRSEPVFWLTQGYRYYIEALHKQGVGSDNIAVGWQLPDGTMERPIPGSRLSPFMPTDASARIASTGEIVSSPENGTNMALAIFPNPARQGTVTLTIPLSVNETDDVRLQFVSLTGKVIYADNITCNANCNTITIDVDDRFSPGMYVVHANVNQKQFTSKLMIH